MKMITYRRQNQVEQFISISLREKSLGNIEQWTECLHTRCIALALIIDQYLACGREQFIASFKWFEQQPVHTLAQGTDGGFHGTKASHDQHINIALDQLSPRDHVKAVHFRHTDIHDQQIHPLLLEMLNGGAWIC